MNEAKPYIITKYALGSGKTVVRYLRQSGGSGPLLFDDKNMFQSYCLGQDAFPVHRPDMAIAAIEAMKEKKLASLRKQIARLEAFDPAEAGSGEGSER